METPRILLFVIGFALVLHGLGMFREVRKKQRELKAEIDALGRSMADLQARSDRTREMAEQLEADLEEYDHGNDVPLLRRFDDRDEP